MPGSRALQNNIKSIRNSLGQTQEQFGRNFDPPADKSIVSKWERGITEPQSSRLVVLAKLGGMSVPYLVTGKKTSADMSPEEMRNEILSSVDLMYQNSIDTATSVLDTGQKWMVSDFLDLNTFAKGLDDEELVEAMVTLFGGLSKWLTQFITKKASDVEALKNEGFDESVKLAHEELDTVINLAVSHKKRIVRDVNGPLEE